MEAENNQHNRFILFTYPKTEDTCSLAKMDLVLQYQYGTSQQS